MSSHQGKLISEAHCTCGQAVDAQTAVTAAAVGQSAFRSSWDVASVYFPTMSSEVPNTRFLSERETDCIPNESKDDPFLFSRLAKKVRTTDCGQVIRRTLSELSLDEIGT